MPEKPTPPEETPSAETRRDWEVIQENVGSDKTERLRIAGGWLYRTVVGAADIGSGGVSCAMVFVPGNPANPI